MTNLVHWDEVEWEERTVGEIGGRSQDLGTAAGSASVGLRRFQVAPGLRSTPPHQHGSEEEIFYVLGGAGLLWQDGDVCSVTAGDCIAHPAWEGAHTLRAGSDGLDVLAFGMRQFVETCWHPHSDRIWVGEPSLPLPPHRSLWEWDAEAGPLEFPPPGERFANVAATGQVAVSAGGEGECRYQSRNLGKATGSVRTGLNHDTALPGMLGCPPHCHSAEEELFVVLEGDGSCLLGDDTHPVRPGHVLARPAGSGVAHAFRGGPGGIVYLSFGTREPNDIAYYPRSNKISWRGVGVIGRIERLEYWDGER